MASDMMHLHIYFLNLLVLKVYVPLYPNKEFNSYQTFGCAEVSLPLSASTNFVSQFRNHATSVVPPFMNQMNNSLFT